MRLNLTVHPRLRIGIFPLILLGFMGIAVVVAMVRFASGIGAITGWFGTVQTGSFHSQGSDWFCSSRHCQPSALQ